MTIESLAQTEQRRGVWMAVGAYLLWGLAPVYFKWLVEIPAYEILAHRVVWSVPLILLLLLVMRLHVPWRELRQQPQLLGRLAISSVMIGSNWFMFVWAVTSGRILETSLGYFINPLFTIALGVLVLRESLSQAQKIALLLALLGVGWQIYIRGTLPWVALGLAGTFGIYSLIRKQTPVGALGGLLVETSFLLPVALAYLSWLLIHNTGALSTGSWGLRGLLVCAGIVTTVPLALFSGGARRISLSFMGFLQYISPSCTFLLAIFVYREPFDQHRFISFVAIWLGLALISWDNWQRRKRKA